MGCISCLFKKLVKFVIFFLIIVFIPNLPPKTTFDFEHFDITPAKDLVGPLALNTYLDNAERLLVDRLYGPEFLLKRGNDLYASVCTGQILKINGNHITHVAKFGEACEYFEQAKCGRPLGLAFDVGAGKNNLLATDAYYGIWQINLDSGETKLLVSPWKDYGTENPRKSKFFNDLAIHSSGDFYFTDSSSDFGIDDALYSFLTNPSGRIFHYSRAKNETTVLVDRISFPNGIILSPNEDFLVIAETGRGRLIKYHLTGSNKGTWEVFVDGLPGTPDNITPDLNGIWVPLVSPADKEHPSLLFSMAQVPLVRKFILRIFALIEFPFKLLDQVMPNDYAKKAIYFLGSQLPAVHLLPKRSTIVFVDWNGNIVASLHGSDATAGRISHVIVDGDYLVLGSPFNRFLARVKYPAEIRKLITEHVALNQQQRSIPVSETSSTSPPPPTTTTTTTTTTSKPPTTTTTTPKPTTTAPPTTQKPVTQSPTTQKPATQPPTTQKPATQPPTTQKPVTETPTTQKPTTKSPPPPPTKKPTTQSPTPTKPLKGTRDHPPQRDPKLIPKNPAPIHEKLDDNVKQAVPPLKVIKKGGVQGEL